jgi:hypothetical protein
MNNEQHDTRMSIHMRRNALIINCKHGQNERTAAKRARLDGNTSDTEYGDVRNPPNVPTSVRTPKQVKLDKYCE